MPRPGCVRGNRVIAVLFAGVVFATTYFVPTLAIGDTVPSISFVDQLRGKHRFDEFRGRAVAISFIYTRCPDPRECPAVTSKFAALARGCYSSPAGAARANASICRAGVAEESPSTTGQGAGQRPVGATRRKVPQRTDRRTAPRGARGKGETVR